MHLEMLTTHNHQINAHIKHTEIVPSPITMVPIKKTNNKCWVERRKKEQSHTQLEVLRRQILQCLYLQVPLLYSNILFLLILYYKTYNIICNTYKYSAYNMQYTIHNIWHIIYTITCNM